MLDKFPFTQTLKPVKYYEDVHDLLYVTYNFLYLSLHLLNSLNCDSIFVTLASITLRQRNTLIVLKFHTCIMSSIYMFVMQVTFSLTKTCFCNLFKIFELDIWFPTWIIVFDSFISRTPACDHVLHTIMCMKT